MAGKAGHGFELLARNQAVYDILRYRNAMNQKGGRAFRKLSGHAKHILQTGVAGKDFWRKFFVEFKHKVHITQEVNNSDAFCI